MYTRHTKHGSQCRQVTSLLRLGWLLLSLASFLDLSAAVDVDQLEVQPNEAGLGIEILSTQASSAFQKPLQTAEIVSCSG
jgi:hypothetical protein